MKENNFIHRLIKIKWILIIIIFSSTAVLHAQNTVPSLTFGLEESSNPEDFGLTIKILFMMTILSLAPSIMIMMTSFTRIIVVFHFLRSALGTSTAPSNQILVGLALFITFFIMGPLIKEINTTSLQPYLASEITQDEAIENATGPIKSFMLHQINEKSLEMFISYYPGEKADSIEDLSLLVIIPAFIVSELSISFQIGFLLYLPMLLLDMIIASILMSMGMMMLPPIMISMPFKIMLFVLVDGWNLVIESLVQGIKV